MKKSLVAVVIILSGTFINAQEKIQYGLKGGVNIASINGDTTANVDQLSRINFHFGGVVEIPVSDWFSFQPELVYSGQGTEFRDFIPTQFGSRLEIVSVLKYDYITLPLLAKFYIAKGFSLETGPQVGLLINAKGETRGGGALEDVSIDLKDLVKTVDFGLNFGMGYKLAMGLNFGARYNLGLSNIIDNENSEERKDKNSVFQFSVGYFFN